MGEDKHGKCLQHSAVDEEILKRVKIQLKSNT